MFLKVTTNGLPVGEQSYFFLPLKDDHGKLIIWVGEDYANNLDAVEEDSDCNNDLYHAAMRYLEATDYKVLPDYDDPTDSVAGIKANRQVARELIRAVS